MEPSRSHFRAGVALLVAASSFIFAGCQQSSAASDSLPSLAGGGAPTAGSTTAGTSTTGTCDAASSPVKAHLVHTKDSRARAAIACAECHPPVCSPGQVSNVAFGALASAQGATPSYARATATCSGTYCHGAMLASPNLTAVWAYVDPVDTRPASVACAVCHGYPPPSHAAGSTDCSGCHPDVVKADGTIDLVKAKHVNGVLDFGGPGGGGACNSCHGFPPATGAHVAHFGLTGLSGGGYTDVGTLETRYASSTPTTAPAVYAFGCATCHSTVASNHRNGKVDTLLAEAGATGIKARNASSAAWNPATTTCSGVYCHSGGQETPAYVTSPAWNSGAHLDCAGCHGNPPRYPTGGEGSPTANSHVTIASDGYETGHYMGMPGPWHTTKHGGNWGPTEDATPITCQTCHYDTTDPASTGPSGFYWLDTTGTYDLGGWLGTTCTDCHGKANLAAPLKAGRVLPLRHVNGTRDVAFDVRSTIPAIAWLPPSPNQPVAAYWMTGAGTSLPWPLDAIFTGTTVSYTLQTARYAPATKTCTNVACHLAQGVTSSPTTPAAIPLRWGGAMEWTSAGCTLCHPM